MSVRRIDAVALAARLLGTHVGRGPREVRTGAEVLLAQGHAEIRDDGPTGLVQQDIGRLDVAVDQALLVGVVQGLGHGSGQAHRVRQGQAALAQPRRQVGPLDERRHDVAEAVGRATHVEDRHNACDGSARPGCVPRPGRRPSPRPTRSACGGAP